MDLDPRVIEAFDQLFASMGVTDPEKQAAIVREVYASEELQHHLRDSAARLITEVSNTSPDTEG